MNEFFWGWIELCPMISGGTAGGKRRLDVPRAKNAMVQNLTSAIFSAHIGKLRLAHPNKLAMDTTNPGIAKCTNSRGAGSSSQNSTLR